MKKIYTCLSLLIVITIGSFAQSLQPLSGTNGAVPASEKIRWKHSGDDNNSRSISSRWLNYWFVQDSIAIENASTPALYYAQLFPDSDVVICDAAGANCSRPGIHLIGNVLDPNSADMQTILGYTWSNSNGYFIDSLDIIYDYQRAPGSTAVDTLVAYLWNNATPADIATNYWYTGSTASNYGVDTVKVGILPYDSTGKNVPKPSAAALKTFKIPLTIADTAYIGSIRVSKTINTNHFSVPAGKLVASAFGFIPGYSYSAGDTVTKNNNAFAFLSSEPNGASTYSFYTKGDWNLSQIVNNTNRYNISPTGYNGHFIPTYAFTQPYHIEQHLISYYVTGTFDAGINESSTPGGLKLFQNQPNPSNQTTLIKYEMVKAGTVRLEVRDVTGRLVMELDGGYQGNGKHSVQLDVSGFSNGMYLYTLKTNDDSVTRRMVIAD